MSERLSIVPIEIDAVDHHPDRRDYNTDEVTWGRRLYSEKGRSVLERVVSYHGGAHRFRIEKGFEIVTQNLPDGATLVMIAEREEEDAEEGAK